MPARPTRRRSEPSAGPPIHDERITPSREAASRAAVPVPASKPRKFTLLIDEATDERFARLLTQLQADAGRVATRENGSGHIRSGFPLSRADLLRALLEVAETNPDVMPAAAAAITAHYRTPL